MSNSLLLVVLLFSRICILILEFFSPMTKEKEGKRGKGREGLVRQQMES